MGIEQHRTDQVYAVIKAIVENGQAEFRPGHIAQTLREAGSPLLSWEVRWELARLEADGLVARNEQTGGYTLTAAARKTG